MITYNNANEAFEETLRVILKSGHRTENTVRLLNHGFYIENPINRTINNSIRKWSHKYAQREWLWYLSENRSVAELKKHAPIWDNMHGGDNIVNSNYGFLWNENKQLTKVIEQLNKSSGTRQAYISIFDGKRKDEYEFDTPCTLSIGFLVVDNKLCMNVNMRSNDIWFGFCNDQYCFSMLQEYVAWALGLDIGWYYHHAHDMHLYLDKLEKAKLIYDN